MHSKEFAGNQGKRLNFDPSILQYKFGLILRKFHRLVLGLVGLIDAKGIDVA